MRRLALVLIAFSIFKVGAAQSDDKGVSITAPPIICYAGDHNAFTEVGPPAEYIQSLRVGQHGRTQAPAQIIVTYDGFTPQAQACFQKAVDIWSQLIQSPVPIRITARWASLGPNTLGSAGAERLTRDFSGAPLAGVFYPIALAEKISGTDLNGASTNDILATFNSTRTDWHFGLDLATPQPANTFDLVSVVLHEIGHGLGIADNFDWNAGIGNFSTTSQMPVAFVTSIETGTGDNIVSKFQPTTAALGTALTSNNLFYKSDLVLAANAGNKAKIFAPVAWDNGSSLAHLDETTYLAGDPNALMTPSLNPAERAHDPGPIVKAILKDMGWSGPVVKHTKLNSSETAVPPYRVVATVASDVEFPVTEVILKYKTGGTTFTNLTMTATGVANEFAANLPPGSPRYTYFVSVKSVKDNNQRTVTAPATFIKAGSDPVPGQVVFAVGTDTKGPFIKHTPQETILPTEQFVVQAVVSDDFNVSNVRVEWKLKGVAQTDGQMPLVAGSDSTYRFNITPSLGAGDKIEYRIRATDNSAAKNVRYIPSSSTYFELNVPGFLATRDFYNNNFNDLSNLEFFGNGFTVSMPTGLANGALNTEHPYQGSGTASPSRNFIYHLKVPVKIEAGTSVMTFDEIVLVEPGKAGFAWPHADFLDYVVVEGSKDGGLTWKELTDGYDARHNADWSTLWTSTYNVTTATSTGAPTPALYRNHSFNILSKFQAGDVVAFRFRLFSDRTGVGWGWAIDNLKIQFDDTPPLVLHQHHDFMLSTTTALDITSKITDAYGLNKVFIDYQINSAAVQTSELGINPATDTYTLNLNLASQNLKGGDELQYRIRAIDKKGNIGTYPPTGFIKTAVIGLSAPVDQIFTDFSSASADIGGNFFTTSTPSGFSSAGLSAGTPYPAGLDIDQISEYSFVTKKAVKVSASNPYIYYEDVALVEYTGTSVKDYVIVEASKDAVTWEPLVAQYAAHTVSSWKTAFDGNAVGAPAMIEKHLVNLTTSGKFKAGDVIIIRFRLHSDAAVTGWGWFVDNVSIQGPTTGVEPQSQTRFVAWPNPVARGSLNLLMDLPGESPVKVEILSVQGQVLTAEQFSAPKGEFRRAYETADWAEGFYVVRVRSDFGTTVQKIIKLR